ncbi:FtsX-like permease family protein [Dokdonia sinensis]|uniref:FtsX-like permease family protein n=1 Tax=Dokdonia sinensis TaxID=2479847 RepID=A0A3M0FVQ8_9FLAO|nr:ABC transporter permease [Dokdonia sinensis]RMB56761.1 FtsX-like permease family protein [Dokdonia sinensis]
MFKGLSALQESFRFAVNAMKNNILRTFLSLLGVTVGIFSIIGVLAAVDSLDKEIRGSLSSLDQSTMLLTHVSFGPTEVPRWKREQFPVVTYEEYQYLQRSLPDLKAISYGLNVAPQTIKYNDETLENVQIGSTTEGYYDIESIEFQEGRFFSEQESVNGNPVVVIGDEIRNKLFGQNGSAVGKKIRLYSRKFTVIGVMKKEGAGVFGPSKDEIAIIPATIVMRIYGGNNRSVFPIITMLPEEDADYDGFLAQAEQKLRQKRGLKPDEVSTFFINQLKGFAAAIGEVIGVLKLIGWGIGGFSLLVGGFGIANIMFVSVKERTNLIGIQKALGAKRRFILFQFLFESILLSVFGGIIGLVLVWLITLVLTNAMDDFEFVLSFFNIMLGLSVTFIIGIIAGIIPAIGASRLDPVEAIRTGM